MVRLAGGGGILCRHEHSLFYYTISTAHYTGDHGTPLTLLNL